MLLRGSDFSRMQEKCVATEMVPDTTKKILKTKSENRRHIDLTKRGRTRTLRKNPVLENLMCFCNVPNSQKLVKHCWFEAVEQNSA